MMGFWRGYLTCALVGQLMQDWYGKEAYLAAVDRNWVDSRWYMWAVALCVVALWPTKPIDLKMTMLVRRPLGDNTEVELGP